MSSRTHYRLLLAGDVMLGRFVDQRLTGQSPEYVWGDTLPLFRQADWRACNLECVISDRGSASMQPLKRFHFRSRAENLSALRAAGISAVSLANNHTLDFGVAAMLNMLQLLETAGIAYSGAGPDLVAAASPAITQAGQLRIGWLSFTDNEPDWEAAPDKPGVFYAPVDLRDERTGKLLELVRYTRQRVQLLIVSAHWGGNWGYSPPRSHMDLAHALVTAGADIVFGHSAHVFRGIEIYDGRPIIYSAGDFIDDYAVDPDERNDQSCIFEIEGDAQGTCRLRLHPTVIRDCQAQLARGGEAAEIASKMLRLCEGLGTYASWHPEEESIAIAIK